MNEASFRRSVHRKLPATIYHWGISDRFENGVPDAWYCGINGHHLFIEYKFIALPARDTTLVRSELSPLQLEWISNRIKQGVNCAVVTGSDRGGVWFDDPNEALVGITKTDFLSRRLPAEQIAQRITAICTGELYEQSHMCMIRPSWCVRSYQP